MTEIQKRRSGTISGAERITGVKNAMAEVILGRTLNQYGLKYRKRLQEIKLHVYKLEHETKLLSLDNKTNDLDYKKRLYPESDLSAEEMAVSTLRKYLVKNTDTLCYTDKSLSCPVRNRAATNRIPAIVEMARNTLRQKELLAEMEKARRDMYAFMRDEGEELLDAEPKQPRSVGIFITEDEDDADQDTRKMERLPSMEQARPSTKQTVKSIRERLNENAIVREAIQSQREERQERARTAFSQRIAKKRTLTKSEVEEESTEVRTKVQNFCAKTATRLWEEKEEEFKRGLKFVKDQEKEWNRFMEEVNSRKEKPKETRPMTSAIITPGESLMITRPKTSYVPRPTLTEQEKEQLLKSNLLRGFKRPEEKAQKIPRGVPRYTAKRLLRNTPKPIQIQDLSTQAQSNDPESKGPQ